MTDQERDEAHFAEIDVAMLYIELGLGLGPSGRPRLKGTGAEPHLVEALERSQAQLSDTARQLRQGTFFAVPSAQATL